VTEEVRASLQIYIEQSPILVNPALIYLLQLLCVANLSVSEAEVPVLIIARQHANACRARYCYGKFVGLSVCLSVRHTLVLHLNECTYRHSFHSLVRARI